MTVTLFAVLVARWATGLPALMQVNYWYLSYEHGFIRRALVGTLIWPLIDGRLLGEAVAIVAGLNLVATAALLWLLARLLRDLPWPIIAAFVFSNALPMLARWLGTLDPWMMLAVVGTIFLLEVKNDSRRLAWLDSDFSRRSHQRCPRRIVQDACSTIMGYDRRERFGRRTFILTVVALCAAVPLIHEAGLWVLLPVLAVMWISRRRRA